MANTARPHPYLEVSRTRNQTAIWSGLMNNEHSLFPSEAIHSRFYYIHAHYTFRYFHCLLFMFISPRLPSPRLGDGGKGRSRLTYVSKSSYASISKLHVQLFPQPPHNPGWGIYQIPNIYNSPGGGVVGSMQLYMDYTV